LGADGALVTIGELNLFGILSRRVIGRTVRT
jgi:hypothetical protein